MQIHYTVHSVAATTYEVAATLANGAQVQATVAGLVVELVSADGSMSHTLRFGPDQMAEAVEVFTPDAAITLTFEKDA